MSTPSFDPSAVCSHVEMIHSLAAASNIEGVLTLSCIDSKNNVTTERFAIGDSQNMIASIMAREAHPGLNIYAPWAIFRKDFPRHSKGKEEHVVAALAFVGDLDADTGKVCATLPVDSPYTIETSAGNAQPIFPLSQALLPNEAKAIAVALGEAIGADMRTKDISGLWRIPGTLNWPTKKKLERGRPPAPQLVKIQHAWTGELIEPEKIVQAVAPFARRKEERERSTSNNISETFTDLPAGLKKQIAGSPYQGEDQSETAASVFAQLFRRGWSDNAIESLVEANPNGIGKRYCDGKNLRADIERVRAKFDEPKSEARQEHPQRPLAATQYQWRDPSKIPKREWLYGRLLIRKFVTATVSPGGVGKSSLIAVEALAKVSGKDLLGIATALPLRVWLWNLEDPQEETERKIQAAALHYLLETQDIDDRLFIDSGRDQPLVIATAARNGATIARPVVDALVAEIVSRRIDVLVVDPFVSCHEAAENDNQAMDMIVKEWGRVADRGNCAVHLVHHTPKMAGVEVTTESARGGKAFTDACRVVRAINRMSKEEGEKAGIENHRFYFRTFNDKANLTPPADKSDWFKLESVDLGNGTLPGGFGGDSIGVVTTWQWPDPLAGMTGADFEKAAKAIRAGRWRESSQAKDWVGRAVAEALGLDVAHRNDKAKVTGMVRAWLAAGSLFKVEGLDEKRMPKMFIEVREDA